MDIIQHISNALQTGSDQEVEKLVAEALEIPLAAKTILEEGLLAGMKCVGDRFREHGIFLPDVLLAARAMDSGITLLKPHLLEMKIEPRARVVMGTVQGDLHDLGKNLVSIMLEGAGFEIIDLGRDVSPGQFIEAAQKNNALIIGMSALLTTTMPVMRQVIELLDQRGLKGKIHTLIGGAPVTSQFAAEIGADGYGFDAAKAVEMAQNLLEV